MGEEVVAVALEIVADEIGVVTVGDEADALGQERIVDLDLFQPDRTLLARDLGKAGQFVDQFALRHAAHGEGELHAERQTVNHRREGEADQRRRKRPAEDHDEGVGVDEHAQVAAHEDQRAQDRGAGQQAQTRREIHELTPLNATTCDGRNSRLSCDPRRALLRGSKG